MSRGIKLSDYAFSHYISARDIEVEDATSVPENLYCGSLAGKSDTSGSSRTSALLHSGRGLISCSGKWRTLKGLGKFTPRIYLKLSGIWMTSRIRWKRFTELL